MNIEHMSLTASEYAMLRGTDAKTAKKTFLQIGLKESLISKEDFAKGKAPKISASIIQKYIPSFDSGFEAIKTVFKSQERTSDVMYCIKCIEKKKFCTKHRLYGLILDDQSKERLKSYWDE